MRSSPKIDALLAGVALIGLIAGAPLDPSEWRYFKPILSTQTRPLGVADANRILAEFFQTPVVAVRHTQLRCTTLQLGPAFHEITDGTFFPKGILRGHFLGPDSLDIAVSGSSLEGHPGRWGGTLLLNKQGSGWKPVWYRSAIIIDSCEKIDLPNGREILLCEDEDSGMGNEIHDMYVVDFEHPSDPRDSLLARADTYKDDCFNQKQLLTGFQWNPGRQGFSARVETTEWERLSDEPYCDYLKRPPPSVPLAFTVTSSGLLKVPSAVQR